MDTRILTQFSFIVWLGATLLISGCGGGGDGGGGGGSGPPLTSAPGEAAWSTFLRENHAYTLTGDVNGISSIAYVAYVPATSTTMFNGTANAFTTTISYTLNSEPPSVRTTYYLTNPYVPLGETQGAYGVVLTYTPIPTTLNIGSSGSLDQLTYYVDSTKTTYSGGIVYDGYSVKSNNSASLLFCMNRSTLDDLGIDGSSEDYCYTVDAAGSMNLFSIELIPSLNSAYISYLLKVTPQ